MNTKNPEKKSLEAIVKATPYDSNRKSYAKKNGSYCYVYYDEQAKREVSIELCPGKDGVTEELIYELAAEDHAKGLKARYDREKQDYTYENFKAAIDMVAEGNLSESDFAGFGTFETDPETILAGEKERTAVIFTAENDGMEVDVTIDTETAISALAVLTPEQLETAQKLASGRTLKDIGEEEGVSGNAIANRKKKMQKKILKKLGLISK